MSWLGAGAHGLVTPFTTTPAGVAPACPRPSACHRASQSLPPEAATGGEARQLLLGKLRSSDVPRKCGVVAGMCGHKLPRPWLCWACQNVPLGGSSTGASVQQGHPTPPPPLSAWVLPLPSKWAWPA